MKNLLRTTVASVLLYACAAACAAPYAITYTGVVSNSTIPGVVDGDNYRVTFVMDNGGSTALGQTWIPTELQCTIWRLNSAGTAIFRHNLRAVPLQVLNGSIATDATGALTQMMTALSITSMQSSQYDTSGIALAPRVSWRANGNNWVLSDRNNGSGGTRSFSDAAGGVQMATGQWSAPRAVMGPCDDTPVNPGPQASPVPAAGAPALVLMGLTVAGVGVLRLRRRGWRGGL